MPSAKTKIDRRPLWLIAGICVTIFVGPVILLIAAISKRHRAAIQVGFGPQPLINHLYAVKALRRLGYTAESYCIRPYHITREFDHVLIEKPRRFVSNFPPQRLWLRIAGFVWSIRRFEILAISCHGGLLGDLPVLRAMEPVLFRLSGVKTIIMPYGSDVQDLSKNPTPRYRRALQTDYPRLEAEGPGIQRRIQRWSKYGDVVVNGCDWIDYLDRRDVLTLGSFAIDTETWAQPELWTAPDAFTKNRPMRILHAPNHEAIKGTDALRRAVESMIADGLPIELTIITKRPNSEVREAIVESDLIVDQLVIGWYAMFAIEAMASGRAVISRIRDDLEGTYKRNFLLDDGELPHLRADEDSIEVLLRHLLHNPNNIELAAALGPPFVTKHHSLEKLGCVLSEAIGRAKIPICA